ncbi:hypothetical protein TNCV_4116321 [Trichonephila clavipes]|nr:hypothetical protein TNCV_4116321 [Trichonephila clavipes]
MEAAGPQDTIAVFIFALFTGNGFLRNLGVPQVNGDSMAGKAVSLHSLLANRNGKIYSQNFEADVFPSGVVDL